MGTVNDPVDVARALERSAVEYPRSWRHDVVASRPASTTPRLVANALRPKPEPIAEKPIEMPESVRELTRELGDEELPLSRLPKREWGLPECALLFAYGGRQ